MAVGDAAKRLPRQQPTSRGDSARTHEASLRYALRPVCGQSRHVGCRWFKPTGMTTREAIEVSGPILSSQSV